MLAILLETTVIVALSFPYVVRPLTRMTLECWEVPAVYDTGPMRTVVLRVCTGGRWARRLLSCPLHPSLEMPISDYRRQPCRFKQQVYPRAEKTGFLNDHRMPFALVEIAITLQKIEASQRILVHHEQFAPDREAATFNHRREIAQIEQVEAAVSDAVADEPACFKKVVVAEAAFQ
jgi:hypothetical protein